MRDRVYGVGCPEGNEEIGVQRYERRNREVLEYFKGRPDNLLTFDMSKGDDWEQLCPVLGADIPNKPFQHANKAGFSRKIKDLLSGSTCKIH
jgi:hypothetical protein